MTSLPYVHEFPPLGLADPCWRWVGERNKNGYGWLKIGADRYMAHILSYEAHIGPVPEGKILDHLCHNRWCIQPKHLEPVTDRENTLRGSSSAARYATRDRCDRGHEFTPENTIKRADRGRRCRECLKEIRRRWKEKRE